MKSRTATITEPALALMLSLLPMTAAAQGQAPVTERQTSGVTVPVGATIGTAPGAQPSVPTAGTLTLERFTQQNGKLVALGTLAVTFSDAATQAPRTIVSPAAIPVNQRQLTATCPALHLVLGPLDSTLLELPVHVNQAVVDVTAASGDVNQPGNQICSGANGAGAAGGANTGASAGAPIDQTAEQLNQILAALDQ